MAHMSMPPSDPTLRLQARIHLFDHLVDTPPHAKADTWGPPPDGDMATWLDRWVSAPKDIRAVYVQEFGAWFGVKRLVENWLDGTSFRRSLEKDERSIRRSHDAAFAAASAAFTDHAATDAARFARAVRAAPLVAHAPPNSPERLFLTEIALLQLNIAQTHGDARLAELDFVVPLGKLPQGQPSHALTRALFRQLDVITSAVAKTVGITTIDAPIAADGKCMDTCTPAVRRTYAWAVWCAGVHGFMLRSFSAALRDMPPAQVPPAEPTLRAASLGEVSTGIESLLAGPDVSPGLCDATPAVDAEDNAPDDALETPRALAFRIVEERAIAIEWHHFCLVRTEFELQWRVSGHTEWRTASARVRAAVVRKNNLEPDTSYQFRVRAHCAETSPSSGARKPSRWCSPGAVRTLPDDSAARRSPRDAGSPQSTVAEQPQLPPPTQTAQPPPTDATQKGETRTAHTTTEAPHCGEKKTKTKKKKKKK